MEKVEFRSALLALTAVLVSLQTVAAPPGASALDQAFRFATAIHNDPKDRASAQTAIVLDYGAIGALDVAVERAGAIDGWQRGTAYADLAGFFAAAGRAAEAQALIARAKEFQAGVQGWQNPRISAHVADAHAALGEVDRAKELSATLAAGDSVYAGRAAATVATAQAAQGDLEQALAPLRALDSETDYEVAWWRTAGYLGIARRSSVPREKRLEVLQMARRSAAGIPGWKRAEALESIADEFRRAEAIEPAREALSVAETLVLAQADTSAPKAALMSNLARGWDRVGEKQRARQLLEGAESIVPAALVIDRPAIYANLASTSWLIGDERQATRLYDLALGGAEALVNARPRALAVVAICRAMGRNGVPLTDATRARLDALFAGLKDPW